MTLEKKKILIIVASVASVASLLVFVLLVVYASLYTDRAYPGVSVAGVRLDGFSRTESASVIQHHIDTAVSNGFSFSFKGKNIVVDAKGELTNPDTSHDLVHYEIDQALTDAFALGRGDSILKNTFEQLSAFIFGYRVFPKVFVDRTRVAASLEATLKNDLIPVRDAELYVIPTDPPTIDIRPEQEGVVLIVDPALDELEKQANVLNFHTILLSDQRISPRVTVQDIEPMRAKALEFLSRPLPSFVYGTNILTPSTTQFASWITVTGTRNTWEMSIDPQAFRAGIHELAKHIERESKNGSLIVKEGKVISFVPGTEGRSVDIDTQYLQFMKLWPASTTFPLLVRATRGSLMGEDPEQLGIKELLGTGRSDFSGSPKNRRLNIAHGVQRVDGTIIPPGGEFSMIKILGAIDEANGWLPELVIKGNKTEPEFGGGLCQIGTTAFRGALASGMLITERQNHSYRVRYYEPAGTDATIYDPKPDFRFKNDTPASILISAHIEKDEVIFDFWGTKDGRTASSTYPKISNIVAPPPMKLIETLDLPVGKKKCTETAHAGATAEFTYTVAFPDGTQRQRVFQSFYRPWQAVCLIGVEKISDSVQATSTEGVAPVVDG